MKINNNDEPISRSGHPDFRVAILAPLKLVLLRLGSVNSLSLIRQRMYSQERMDLMAALQLVLSKSLAHGGLSRGLHESARLIERHAAQLCVLAEDCNQADYVKLVKALCAEHNVNLVTVPSAKTLGEWAGIDSKGHARKVVGCACVVVRDYGEESEGLNVVQEYLN